MSNLKSKAIALFILISISYSAKSQDLLSQIEDEKENVYAIASFKTTRIINGHSIENVAKGVFDYKISHRFGLINSGLYNFFGLDQSNIRTGGDYGITDNLMVGLGRSSSGKIYDGFIKYRILKQHTGKTNMPISVSYFASTAISTLRYADTSKENLFSSRIAYTHQLLIARKFNENLTLQLTPTLVHKNLVQKSTDRNDIFALGFGGRYKVSRRVAINAEYFYLLPNQMDANYGVTNSFAIGVDIETGGHVFQLQLTNSLSMIEKGFITETNGKWGKGDIHFGFNIARVFTVSSKN